MEKDVLFKDNGGELVARILGDIDHHTAKRQREAIDAELFKRKPARLVLDFSEVEFMDSSGIALIIGRSEVCAGLGIGISLSGLSGMQKKLIRLSGVEKIKNVVVLQ